MSLSPALLSACALLVGCGTASVRIDDDTGESGSGNGTDTAGLAEPGCRLSGAVNATFDCYEDHWESANRPTVRGWSLRTEMFPEEEDNYSSLPSPLEYLNAVFVLETPWEGRRFTTDDFLESQFIADEEGGRLWYEEGEMSVAFDDDEGAHGTMTATVDCRDDDSSLQLDVRW